MKFKNRLYPAAALSLALGFTACMNDSEEDDGYNVPESYESFENVNFSGQTARLDMLQELGAYIKSGNQGTELDAGKMKAMFANEGSPFSKEELNTSGKQLKDKTFELDRDYFEELFDSAAAASKAGEPGAKGKAGVVTASNGTSKYLMSAKGQEYAQLVEKGLMGAMAFYQAAAGYLDAETKLGESVPDSSKAHHWDEAYGYFTSSVKFPEEGVNRFWSKYANDADDLIGCNGRILRAFAKGRAAIVNDDRDAMLEAIDSVRYEWERVSAASAVHYFNSAKKSLTDDGARNHQLSEGIAFLRALKYNPAKKITVDQLAEIGEKIGDDFYEVTASGLDFAIETLSDIYGFEDVKSQL